MVWPRETPTHTCRTPLLPGTPRTPPPLIFFRLATPRASQLSAASDGAQGRLLLARSLARGARASSSSRGERARARFVVAVSRARPSVAAVSRAGGPRARASRPGRCGGLPEASPSRCTGPSRARARRRRRARTARARRQARRRRRARTEAKTTTSAKRTSAITATIPTSAVVEPAQTEHDDDERARVRSRGGGRRRSPECDAHTARAKASLDRATARGAPRLRGAVLSRRGDEGGG